MTHEITYLVIIDYKIFRHLPCPILKKNTILALSSFFLSLAQKQDEPIY